jgi:hypothetical protein
MALLAFAEAVVPGNAANIRVEKTAGFDVTLTDNIGTGRPRRQRADPVALRRGQCARRRQPRDFRLRLPVDAGYDPVQGQRREYPQRLHRFRAD